MVYGAAASGSPPPVAMYTWERSLFMGPRKVVVYGANSYAGLGA